MENQLKKKLALAGSIYYTGYNPQGLLRKFVTSEDTVIVERVWRGLDYMKPYKWDEADPKDYSLWSSCDKYIEITLYVSDDKFLCDVWIYGRDPIDFDGIAKKFSATIQLPDSFLKDIEYFIEREFSFYLDELYEQEENQKKIKRKKEIAKSLGLDYNPK